MFSEEKYKTVRDAKRQKQRKGRTGEKGVDSSGDAWWDYAYDNFDMRCLREELKWVYQLFLK